MKVNMKSLYTSFNYTGNASAFDSPKFINAKIPNQFEDIKIVVDSEETVFEETYMTGIISNNRIARFKKNVLVFTA